MPAAGPPTGNVFTFAGSQARAVPHAADHEWGKAGAPFAWPKLREAAVGVAPAWHAGEFPAYYDKCTAWYRRVQGHLGVRSPLDAAFWDLFGVSTDGRSRNGRRRAIHVCVCGVDVGVDPSEMTAETTWNLRNGQSCMSKKHILAEKVQEEVEAGRYRVLAEKPAGACIAEVNLVPKNSLDDAYDEMRAKYNRMVVNLSKGNRGGGGLHGVATKERFPEWIPWVHIKMLWNIIGALRDEFGDDVDLEAVVLDLKSAYRTMDVMEAQRVLTMLRVWVFESEADAGKPSSERKLVMRYILDLAAAFGCRSSGYADYELVVGAIWALEEIFYPSVGIKALTAVATDDFIAVGRAQDAAEMGEVLGAVLRLGGFGTDGKFHADIDGALDVPRARTVWIGWGANVTTGVTFCPAAYLRKVTPAYAAWGDGEMTASTALLESLQGVGYWVSNFCPALRPFLSSLIAAKSAWDRYGEHDARTKALVLESRGCSKMIVEVVFPRMGERSMRREISGVAEFVEEMGLITDATRGSDARADGSQETPAGYGIWFNGYFARGTFPPAAIARATNAASGLVDNSLLEMMARTIGVLMLAKLWPVGVERRTVKVTNSNDNSATVGQIRAGRAKWGLANDCLMAVAVMSLADGFDVVEAGDEEWVPSAECIFGDSLSRSVGSGPKAEAGWARFLEENRGRPTTEVKLDDDAPFWAMTDPVAVASYDDFHVPPLPASMFRAWQPALQESAGGATGEKAGAGLRFLAGAKPAKSRSEPQVGTGRDGGQPRASPCKGGHPSSSTRSPTRRGNGMRSCSNSGDSSSGTDTQSRRLGDTSTGSSPYTERCTSRTSSGQSGAGVNGGGDCGRQGGGRQIGRTLHQRPSSAKPCERADGASSTRASSRRWWWLSSVRSDAASTRHAQARKLDDFSFAGEGWYSSPRSTSGAKRGTSVAQELPSRSTGRWTAGRTGSGFLSFLAGTPTYVPSARYALWRNEAAAQRTGPFSQLEKGDSYLATQ